MHEYFNNVREQSVVDIIERTYGRLSSPDTITQIKNDSMI
jgi:hypothetical protein